MVLKRQYFNIMKFGQCLGDTTSGQSYRELVGSNLVETHTYSTTTDCTGAFTKKRRGLEYFFDVWWPGRMGMMPFGNRFEGWSVSKFELERAFYKTLSDVPDVNSVHAALSALYISTLSCAERKNATSVYMGGYCQNMECEAITGYNWRESTQISALRQSFCGSLADVSGF